MTTIQVIPVNNEAKLAARLSYVMSFINQHPLNDGTLLLSYDPGEISLSYGNKGNGLEHQGKHMHSYFDLWAQSVFEPNLLIFQPYSYKSETYYGIIQDSEMNDETPAVVQDDIQIDIFSTLFLLLSHLQEIKAPDSQKDEWGMLHERYHLMCKQDVEKLAIADRLVEFLLQYFTNKNQKKETKYVMTHDIDVLAKYGNLYRATRSFARSFLNGGVGLLVKDIGLFGQVLVGNRTDPHSDWKSYIVDTSNNKFDKKIAYLMAGGETPRDNYYHVNNKIAQEMIGIFTKNQYDIGLHGSYNSNFKKKLFFEEEETLQSAAKDIILENRFHFLRFDFSMTPHILEESTIEIDSTLGYQRRIGFRAGTSFDYHLYDFRNERPYTWVERPMSVMDGALFEEADNDMDKAYEILDSFLNVHTHNAQIVYNIHNTIFDPTRWDQTKLRKIMQRIHAE